MDTGCMGGTDDNNIGNKSAMRALHWLFHQSMMRTRLSYMQEYSCNSLVHPHHMGESR